MLAPLDLTSTPWRRLILSSTRDVWCLVDADDWDWIIKTNWNWGWHSRTPWKFYAKRNTGPQRSTVYLHREIMTRAETPASFALHVDHINGQSLDNRKANLRWVTPLENRRNATKRALIPELDGLLAGLVAIWRKCGAPVLEDAPF